MGLPYLTFSDERKSIPMRQKDSSSLASLWLVNQFPAALNMLLKGIDM